MPKRSPSAGERGPGSRGLNPAREVIHPPLSRTLANQLLRSGTSIGANVEEAQAGQSRPDFINKLFIACKEARETHYWLRLVAATELIPEPRLTELLDEANQLIAILTTVIRRTKEGKE